MVFGLNSGWLNFWNKNKVTEKAKKKILVVEDELALLQILVERLNQKGYEALSARDGEEGRDIALKEHPDLILLDLLLPKLDGMHMLSHLRLSGGKWGKSVPIIILTNLTTQEAMNQAIDAGVKHYLLKSQWKLEDIIKKVEEMLG